MSGSVKEWLVVLGIAVLVHAGAAAIWWWSPSIDFPEPGASSMKLALVPSEAPSDDRAETVSVDQDDPVLTEEKQEPVIVPVKEPIQPVVPPKLPTVPVVEPIATTAPTKPAEQAPASTEQTNSSTQRVETGSAAAEIGPADASAEADYKAQLSSWLARHKRYPRAARRRNLEGVAYLTFTLNSEGGLVSFEVTGSTGYDVLDREVVNMLKRAEPLPRFPAGLNRSVREFGIPIRFELERD